VLFDAAINWAADNTGTPVNQPPSVNAGPDQTIALPAGVTLDGTVTDDALPTNTLTTVWSKISGPGTVTFANASAIDTTASFAVDGVYVLQLQASDSALSSTDTITVTVNAQGSQGNSRVTTGLVALYEFDDTTGTTVADTSGIGTPLNLTINTPAAVSWGTGTLDVTGDTLIATPGPASKINTAVTASGEITVEAWIDPANLTQNGPARIATISADPYARNMTIGQGVYNSTGDRIEARLRSTGTSTNGTPATQTASQVLDGGLQHVVFTRDSTGTTKVFIDGVQEVSSTGNATGTLTNWDTTMRLGLAAELDSSRFWHGTYHLVAIYDQALTPAKVVTNFTAGADPTGTPPPPPPPGVTVVERSTYMFAGKLIAYSIDGTLTTTAAGHLGSTELTNTAGGVNRQTYLPYGGIRSNTTNQLTTDKTYTGQVDDGLGWMHYRARQYDPTLGRFLQADTITTDGLNRYTYVRNNPLNATDPTGRCSADVAAYGTIVCFEADQHEREGILWGAPIADDIERKGREGISAHSQSAEDLAVGTAQQALVAPKTGNTTVAALIFATVALLTGDAVCSGNNVLCGYTNAPDVPEGVIVLSHYSDYPAHFEITSTGTILPSNDGDFGAGVYLTTWNPATVDTETDRWNLSNLLFRRSENDPETDPRTNAVVTIAIPSSLVEPVTETTWVYRGGPLTFWPDPSRGFPPASTPIAWEVPGMTGTWRGSGYG
jgi:RHS repeat-associated protein